MDNTLAELLSACQACSCPDAVSSAADCRWQMQGKRLKPLLLKRILRTSVPKQCCSSFLATAPAATLPIVSLAEARPPPATALMPYFIS